MTARSRAVLGAAVLLPLVVGVLGSVATMDSVRTWYPTLVRPPFAPPSWVFGPVWTTLYLMMGLASWLVWRQGGARPEVRSALAYYGVQLLLNLAWSWLFFVLKQPFLALLDIVALLVLVAVTALRFAAISRGGAMLMVPYLAWVLFATVLNGGYWWLNRHST